MLTDSSEEASVYVVSLQLLNCPCQGADVHDVATDIFEVYRKVYTSKKQRLFQNRSLTQQPHSTIKTNKTVRKCCRLDSLIHSHFQ